MPLSSSRKTPDSPTLPCATACWHKRLAGSVTSKHKTLLPSGLRTGRVLNARNLAIKPCFRQSPVASNSTIGYV
jgi:hypothetical protein